MYIQHIYSSKALRVESLLITEAESFKIDQSSRIGIGLFAVPDPNADPSDPMFDESLSTWLFRIFLQVWNANGLVSSGTTYRSPHDLWRLVRHRTAFRPESFPPFRRGRRPHAITPHLLLCSDDREEFTLEVDGEVPERFGVWTKHSGFSFTVCLEEGLLWLDCFSGSPGRVLSGVDDVAEVFKTSVYFPFTVIELLGLPPSQGGLKNRC